MADLQAGNRNQEDADNMDSVQDITLKKRKRFSSLQPGQAADENLREQPNPGGKAVETIQPDQDPENTGYQEGDVGDVNQQPHIRFDEGVQLEESTELTPNLPELGFALTQRRDVLEIRRNNQHHENVPVIKVVAEKDTQKTSTTLYIFLWLPKCSKFQFGHAALLSGEFYISWFPGNKLKIQIKKPPGEGKKSHRDDLIAMDRVPDRVYCFETSNMEAVMDFWRQNQNEAYHLFRNNCIKKVYKALKKAGAPKFIPCRKIISLVLYYFQIPNPNDFNRYCEKNKFKYIEYSEFLKDHPTLAGPIIIHQGTNKYLQILACVIFSLFLHIEHVYNPPPHVGM